MGDACACQGRVLISKVGKSLKKSKNKTSWTWACQNGVLVVLVLVRV